MSIYYSYDGGLGAFTKQAKNSSYYYNSEAKLKPVRYVKGFKNAWKSIKSSIKKVYIYLHGGTGELYFDHEYLEYKKLKKYPKKKRLKKIYLLSCHGSSGEESVAKALYLATGKKARIYASKENVAYRIRISDERITYVPRYDETYIKKHGLHYFYLNPVKRCNF